MNNNPMKLVSDNDLTTLEDAIRNLWMSSDQNNKSTYDRICKWVDSLSAAPAVTDEPYGFHIKDETGCRVNSWTQDSSIAEVHRANRLCVVPLFTAPQPSPAQHDVKRLMDSLKVANELLYRANDYFYAEEETKHLAEDYGTVALFNGELISEIEGRK
jgi:hypothetical protein